jgi:hypothetical protein
MVTATSRVARAHTIWVVENPSNNVVLATFTVKHECVTWLIRQRDREDYDISDWDVMAYPDGAEPSSHPVDRVNAASFAGA